MQDLNGDNIDNDKNLKFSPNDARDSVCSLHSVEESIFPMGNDGKSKVNTEKRKDIRKVFDEMPMLEDIIQESSVRDYYNAYMSYHNAYISWTEK
nr:hypothetical protein [Tanacetum cinerariifolium]